jgi:curved DNA-binding protein CbpA
MAPRIPQRVPGINVLSLPLSTLEGFVFSLVDGRAATSDIAIITGVEGSKLDTILDRLSELGAVDLPWAPRKSRPKVSPLTAQPDAHLASGAARYSPLEIDDHADISRELRKRILDAFYALEGRNHYEALGVPRDAEKTVIRSSYFEMSKLFHPDSQFGKDLGPFRTRMESVFKRLTEAYEVLGKKKKREEYDEYLAVTEQTRRARRAIDRVSREIEAIRVPDVEPEPAPVMPDSSVLRAPRVPSIASPAVSSAPPNASLPPSARAAPVPEVVPRPPISNEERRARVRERLRQRLRNASSRPAPPLPAEQIAPPVSEQNPTERRRSVIEGLRTSIASSGIATGRGDGGVRAQAHLRKAQDAERAQDFLTASGELQLALACDPDNRAIQHEYERVSKVVARSLATNYEKQALYEEKTGNWKAAAISWGRVSDNREDDENAARRTAEALLKSSGDLHRAQRYAQKAVQLAANNVQNLTLLGRVYLAAGLKLNAQRELEKAAKLDPRDQIVNNLLRESRS